MNNDLISRNALIQHAYSAVVDGVEKDIIDLSDVDNAPTVSPDMEFAKWVTKMIFDNNTIKDFDFELFSELACRKLEKLGLVEKTESEWIKKGGAE